VEPDTMAESEFAVVMRKHAGVRHSQPQQNNRGRHIRVDQEGHRGRRYTHEVVTVRRLPLTVVALAVMAQSFLIWQWHDFAEFSSDAPSRFGWFGLLVPAWLVTAAFFAADFTILYLWSRRPRPHTLIVVPALAVLLPLTAYALWLSIFYLGPHMGVGPSPP
jgi:hypothetical protein